MFTISCKAYRFVITGWTISFWVNMKPQTQTSRTCPVVDVLNEAGALSAPRGRVQQHEQDEEHVKDVVCERLSCCRCKQQHKWQTRFDVPTSLGHLQPDGNICDQNNEWQQIPVTQSAALSVCSSSITDQPVMIMYNTLGKYTLVRSPCSDKGELQNYLTWCPVLEPRAEATTNSTSFNQQKGSES